MRRFRPVGRRTAFECLDAPFLRERSRYRVLCVPEWGDALKSRGRDLKADSIDQQKVAADPPGLHWHEDVVRYNFTANRTRRRNDGSQGQRRSRHRVRACCWTNRSPTSTSTCASDWHRRCAPFFAPERGREVKNKLASARPRHSLGPKKNSLLVSMT